MAITEHSSSSDFRDTRKLQQAYNYSRVPTSDELNGDFNNSLFFIASPGIQHLYDPATTTAVANPTRAPFPNDVIPSPESTRWSRAT